MRLVVDASTLVGELLRRRGRELLGSSRIDLYVPERMWEEARHEVSKRLALRVSRGLSESVAASFRESAARVKEQSITEVPEEFYEDLRDEALSRVPQDPNDWQVVALALSLDADILTEDRDFFGCGIAAWTAETLISQLERRGRSPFQS
ncbi:MAG: PIN domain-containing protein [Rubrobacteraceae bacterium]